LTTSDDVAVPMLRGRDAECRALDHLASTARSGESQVLTLHGEAGIGKTALLQYVVDAAVSFSVLRAAGVESDMELAFAGLQQLCAPVLDRVDRLPAPQRNAVEVAFGLREGDPPDRFLVGLAVLGLLAAASGDGPVLCVIDDAQWLDRVSAQTLGFVARRLLAEPVALLFASRDVVADLAGLPLLEVGGLSDVDSRELLDSAVLGRLDARVRDRIIAETRGNPLALLELPRNLGPAELAGGYYRPDTRSVPSQVEEHFVRRIRALPPDTRRLVTVAAAEPLGDPTLLLRAGAHLGLAVDSAAPAEAAGLLDVGQRVGFRHPLVRSAAYRDAPGDDRRAAHRALAEVTDAVLDPDRRAWHRAHAAVGPDEDVAAELERSAGRAQVRGGTSAAAAFLTRAAELTPDPALRGARALAAAEAKAAVAAADAADDLLAMAELAPLDDLQRARLDQLRARLLFSRSRGSGSAPTLLESVRQFADTARRLETLDRRLAGEAHLDAVSAAMYVGRLGGSDLVRDTAVATVTALGGGDCDRLTDQVAAAMALLLTSGPVAAIPALRAAGAAITARTWLWQAFPMAHEALVHEPWDDDAWHRLASEAVRLATEAGALEVLPRALVSRAGVHVQAGEFDSARQLIVEANEISAVAGVTPVRYHGLALLAWTGDERETIKQADAIVRDGTARGEGRVFGLAGYATAVLYNGLGRYQVALDAVRRGCEYEDIGLYSWSLIELVEAAVRAGEQAAAADALEELSERTTAAGTDWALASRARSQALLAGGAAAEDLYVEALERFGRTRIKVQLERARLLYGEWLRRQNRRTDARAQLRVAHESFSRMGADAFADRARRELLATGEKARKRAAAAGDELTPQERQIAELAGAGLTNPEIGAQLFISAHTVEWHLRKVFAKLAIRSRRELRDTPWNRDR
jgi:DNA-binding CsgD family transcriptional regulator